MSINIFLLEDKELEMSVLPFENHPFFDKVAIIVASTDKSLNGNYAKATSYLVAEDIEMTIFVLLARKKIACLLHERAVNHAWPRSSLTICGL
jgi:hypothetical protein